MDNEISRIGSDEREPLSLNSIEIDAIGEILNISMGSAATALSTLLGRKVSITTPTVTTVESAELTLDNLEPAVGIEIEYLEGISGHNLLVMKRRDIKAIVNLLLSDMAEVDDGELDEIHISAVSEIMNQMMGASATALASFLNKSINISTPKQFDIDNKREQIAQDENNPVIVCVRFMLEVEDLLNSEFVTIMTVGFTKELVQSALEPDMAQEAPEEEEEPAPPPRPKEEPVEKKVEKRKDESPKNTIPQPPPKTEPVSVRPVKLQNFDDDGAKEEQDEEQKDNFNLILGVPLDVSVEIGRTRMPVKNILDIRQGSIVELDRQAGDPVDVMVNGQLIARGDVVIIDDNFGVRITEIRSRKDIYEKTV